MTRTFEEKYEVYSSVELFEKYTELVEELINWKKLLTTECVENISEEIQYLKSKIISLLEKN